MPAIEMSDEEVFGKTKELSDADVFGGPVEDYSPEGAFGQNMAKLRLEQQWSELDPFGARDDSGLRNIVNNPGEAMSLAMVPGKVAYLGAADVISKVSGQPEYGGNLAAWSDPLKKGDSLPVESFLASTSKDQPKLTTLAKIGGSLTEMAPALALGGAPAWAQKLIAGGFSLDMIAKAPELFKEYAEEINKPESEQDYDKLTTLKSGIAQTFTFAPLAGAHATGGLPAAIGDRVVPGRMLAKAMNESPMMMDRPGLALADRAAIENSRLPDRPPAALPAPTAAETARLIDQAIKEQQTGLVVPGELSALEKLKRQFEDQIIPGEETRSVANRPEGAQGGQISFAAGAGAEAIPSARQSAVEATPAPEPVTAPKVEAPLTGRARMEARAAELAKSPSEIVPSAKPIDELQSASALPEKDFIAFSRQPGGYNQLSKTAGLGMKTVADLDAALTLAESLPAGMDSIYKRSMIREAIEVATDSHSWQEKNMGGGKAPLGARPLDFKTDPAAAKWLAENEARLAKVGLKAVPEHVAEWKAAAEGKPATPTSAASIGKNDAGIYELQQISPSTAEWNTVQKYKSRDEAFRSLPRGSGWRIKPPTEIIEPRNDTAIGKNVAGEKIYERADGSVYRLRLDRKDRPNGYPDFGGDLAPANIVSKLESLKFDREGIVGANPFPEIGKAVWNTGIDVAIASVKAGRKIGEAVDAAISHLKKNAKGFDEAKVRSYLSDLLTKEGDSVPNTASGEVAMRKSAERATTSPMVPKPVQEEIANAPESFYNRQSMRRVEDEVGGMTLDQKLAIPRDSNLYTAARLDAAREYFEAGKNSEGYQVFVELEKEGTRLGQLVNQFKLLKGSRAVDVVRIVNESLKKSGRDVLTKDQAATIEKTAADSKAKDSALDTATDAWTKDPTDANAKAAEASLNAANKAAVELQRRIGRFQPRGTAQILKSVLQGNLLTPISQVANLVGNASFLPFRAGARGTATLLDIVDSAIRKKPREVSVQPVAGTAEAAKGAARGIAKVPELLARGAGDTIKGETRAGLHPIRAWIDQFAKNPERPTTGGKLTLKDRMNMAIEGTFGIPAEAMLRGLGAGDLPFREAARARVISEQLKLSKVPRERWSFAQKFPELFFDRAKLDQIHADTMGAIFQRDSTTLNHITNWIRGKGDVFDLAVATVAPYKLTPWNIIGEIMSYNPLIALARGTADAVKGNTRSAKLNAGKLVMGSLLTGTGWWLYKNGLLAPSLDEPDEAQKARLLSNEVLPPNHINVSGLERKLKGGDPAFQPGDKTADVFRAGGLAGAMFYMTANIGRDFERKPETANSDLFTALLSQSTLEQARFGLNQSFLSGVEGLLTAVKDGNADSYLQQYAQTVLALPMPNTLNAISRVNREYKVDMKEDTLRKRVENLVKTRAGISEYLPVKRGLWGEPLRETPEGRNAIAYQFFDITKGKQVTDDPVSLELYRLWRKTADNAVIPSIPAPTRELTVANKTYPLNAEQYSRYVELVGAKRKTVTDALVVNPNFHALTDEGKIKILKQAYDVGQNVGRALFLKESLGDLQAKPGRAGF